VRRFLTENSGKNSERFPLRTAERTAGRPGRNNAENSEKNSVKPMPGNRHKNRHMLREVRAWCPGRSRNEVLSLHETPGVNSSADPSIAVLYNPASW
jgi:hypothetical protein